MLTKVEEFNRHLAVLHSGIRPTSGEKAGPGRDDQKVSGWNGLGSVLSHAMLILRSAIDEVPYVRFALGVAGIAAAVAIITTLTQGYTGITVIAVALVFIAMVVLSLLAGVSTSRDLSTRLGGRVIVWCVTLFVISFMVMTTTAAAAGWPCNWSEFLHFRSACTVQVPLGDQGGRKELQEVLGRLKAVIKETPPK